MLFSEKASIDGTHASFENGDCLGDLSPFSVDENMISLFEDHLNLCDFFDEEIISAYREKIKQDELLYLQRSGIL